MGLFMGDERNYSPEVIVVAKIAASRLESTGAPQLIKVIESKLKKHSGSTSVLSTQRAEMRYHYGYGVDIGFTIEGVASDLPDELSGSRYINATYLFKDNQIVIGDEARSYYQWDNPSVVNKIMESAGYEHYSARVHSHIINRSLSFRGPSLDIEN